MRHVNSLAPAPGPSVLVILDSPVSVESTLERAWLIAASLACRLEVLDVTPPQQELFANQDTVPGAGDERLELWLQRWFAERESTVEFTYQRGSFKHWVDEVLQLRERCNAVLVVKQCDRQHSRYAWHTPDDWVLLRECACPVLMLKLKHGWQGGRVLAAVDAAPDDRLHAQLNSQVLQLAELVARRAQCERHLVAFYAPPMLGGDPATLSLAALESRAYQGARGQVTALKLPEPHYHLEEGPVDTGLPRIVAALAPDLIVLGTAARRNLLGSLFGNLAEQMLDQLSCDLLVVPQAKDTRFYELLLA